MVTGSAEMALTTCVGSVDAAKKTPRIGSVRQELNLGWASGWLRDFPQRLIPHYFQERGWAGGEVRIMRG